MKSDPFVLVVCDKCEADEFEANLTPLAGNCFDMRSVDGQLKQNGWTVDDGRHYCAGCTEDANATDNNT